MSKMTKSSKGYVIGSQKFAAITAVEGLALKPASKARLEGLRTQGLSQEERRHAVIKAFTAHKAR